MRNAAEIIRQNAESWQPPEISGEIPHGDMPGDKVNIGREHIKKINVLFPRLMPYLAEAMEQNENGRAVVAISGGSGVGKSETASLLSYYLSCIGIGSYTMSGDNYPRRIPQQNDAERLRIYRVSGIRGLVTGGLYNSERAALLKELQLREIDADSACTAEYPWLRVYQKEGRAGLCGYLGTDLEQDFAEVTSILSQFKNGADAIWLKRMGREETDLWYEKVDFSAKSVLVIEWTHGNSSGFQGVDIPILLNSTPEETREHRRIRSRDGKIDSPFTETVLEIEQKLLERDAEKAKIIVSKGGEILTYRQYRALMAESER